MKYNPSIVIVNVASLSFQLKPVTNNQFGPDISATSRIKIYIDLVTRVLAVIGLVIYMIDELLKLYLFCFSLLSDNV